MVRRLLDLSQNALTGAIPPLNLLVLTYGAVHAPCVCCIILVHATVGGGCVQVTGPEQQPADRPVAVRHIQHEGRQVPGQFAWFVPCPAAVS